MNVLITGASSGIARSVIKKLLKKDCFIYVTVHTEKQLELAKKRYENEENIECFKLDITKKEDRNQIKKLDIDVLLCNAAIGEGGSMAEIDMNRVRNNFEVNVFSNFELVQLTLKQMMKKENGKIIMMSSLSGIVPINFIGSYSATKASIIKMTETLRNELKLLDYDIDIVLIEPGLYATGFNRVMFENKYDFMNKNSYFKDEIEMIRNKENCLLSMWEKKNLNSIACKITHAIVSDHPRRIYKAPCLQKMYAKLYMICKG